MHSAPDGWWDDERSFVGSRPRWALIVLAWSIPAAIAVLQSAAGFALRGTLGQEWIWVSLQFPRWMTWALATPVIFEASRRIPFRRDRLARSVATHVVIALAVAAVIEFVWLTINLRVQAYVEPESMARMSQTEIYAAGLISRLVGGAFTYAAVLGVATTLSYHRRFRQRELRTAQLEAQLAVAQVQALKMQVHPHFLFNTLHAVTVLIREDPTAATRVVTRLGDLLRLTLARATSAEVSFRRELEILTLYLEIERTRFHDRLAIHYDVQPATLDALVPDLVLQPLVENAIKHGVSPHAGTGRIDVSSHRDGDWLILEIRDNGAGIAPKGERREGIGLTTTKERLERLYGTDHELLLGNAPAGGFLARIRIPFRLAVEDRPAAPANAAVRTNAVASLAAGD